MKVDSSTAGLDRPVPGNSDNLFLYVSGWMEGMSSWMISLSEMLVLAKEMNATFVEPCVKKGNLCSCAKPGNNRVRLSHILDMRKLRKYHPAIVTYEEFQQRTLFESDMFNGSLNQICMHHFSPRPLCANTTHLYNATNIPQVNHATRSSYNTTSTLEIKRYGRYAFRNSQWVSDTEASRVKRKVLRLAPAHGRSVDTLLEQMGIGSNQTYSVIHWRAELPDIDYMACAKRIVRARDKMNLEHRVILMSSLNTDASYTWAGAKHLAENTTSDIALQLLFDAGFLKLDHVVNYGNLSDSVMLAVYDLMLAIKAEEFVTCGKRCGDKSICAACNWRGQFAGLAMTWRREVAHKASMECWPS